MNVYVESDWANTCNAIHPQRDKFRLRVVAADRGDPPLWADVDVELDVVDRNNKPPLWDLPIYGPIFVKENVTVGTVVTSVKARSVGGRVAVLKPPSVPHAHRPQIRFGIRFGICGSSCRRWFDQRTRSNLNWNHLHVKSFRSN